MAHVEKSIEINVPVHTAYNQWTQFETFPQFMDGVKEVQQLDDKRLHWRAEIGGKDVEWDAEITEQEPDMRIAWRNTDGAQNAGVVTFHHIADGRSRVMLQMDVEPHGIAETVGDKLGFLDRKVEGDLDRFKELVEKQGTESGAWRGTIEQRN